MPAIKGVPNFSGVTAGVDSVNAIAGAVVVTSPDSSVTITPNGQNLELEAAGGVPGTPGLSIQGANAGGTAFVGIPGASFDPVNGDITIAPSGSTFSITAVDDGANTFTIAGNQTANLLLTAGHFLIVSGSTGNNGFYLISSASLVSGSTVIVIDPGFNPIPSAVADGSMFIGTTALTVNGMNHFDSLDIAGTGSGVALNIVVTGDDQGGTGITSNANFTDDGANAGTEIQGAIIGANLHGSDATGDAAIGLIVGATNDATIGAPANLQAIAVASITTTVAPVNKIGIGIQDQNSDGFPASGLNAAFSIDNQTAGANVYAIKTGLGPVSLGDVLELTPVAFAALPSSPVEGMIVPINNSNVNTFGTAITGTSAFHGLAYYTGSAWTFR